MQICRSSQHNHNMASRVRATHLSAHAQYARICCPSLGSTSARCNQFANARNAKHKSFARTFRTHSQLTQGTADRKSGVGVPKKFNLNSICTGLHARLRVCTLTCCSCPTMRHLCENRQSSLALLRDSLVCFTDPWTRSGPTLHSTSVVNEFQTHRLKIILSHSSLSFANCMYCLRMPVVKNNVYVVQVGQFDISYTPGTRPR